MQGVISNIDHHEPGFVFLAISNFVFFDKSVPLVRGERFKHRKRKKQARWFLLNTLAESDS